MDELYITSARTDIEGESGLDKPDGGSLYVVKNLGYRGIERYRYAR
jgi:sugar lactone lactonase YvrE